MIYILDKTGKQIATHDMKLVSEGYITLQDFLATPKQYYPLWKSDYTATLYKPKGLEDYKEELNEQVNKARANRLLEPIVVSGVTYDVDKDSKEMMSGFILSGQIVRELLQDDSYVHKTEWTDYYNKKHMVTDFDLKMVVLQLAMRTDDIFSEFREIKERIENATTIEELEVITWVEATIFV